MKREEELTEVAKSLLERWDAFEASYANQEEAYYKLAKYARPDWERLRAALLSNPKPEPVGWETESEWELEMRCANITENTPFAEVSKLINDLWQQYCLAAEPKPEAEGVTPLAYVTMAAINTWKAGNGDPQSHVFLSTGGDLRVPIYEGAPVQATEGGAHEKGLRAHCESAASLFETLSEDLPDDDVSGIMMRVMAENIRKAIGGHADD